MADKVFIVLSDAADPGKGKSIYGVFSNRTDAEKCIAHYIKDYNEKTGWIRKYPDKNDKRGYIWLEREDGIPEITWIIQSEFVKKEFTF